MATKEELRTRVIELEAARVQATALYRITRGLNAVRDENELLKLLARPAIDAGACSAGLMYIDLDEAGEPKWNEVVANWQRKDAPPPISVGTRYYLPEFPFFRLFIDKPSETLLIADAATDERIDEKMRDLMAQMGAQAVAIIPLTQVGRRRERETERRWVGFLMSVWDKPHEHSQEEIEIYKMLIGVAAPAVENRRLVDNLERMVAERVAEVETMQQEVIKAQQLAIQELSTPIIPIMDRIIVMPLIGSIDTMRARDIMRSLLAGIREHRARVVILDITGVPIVDSGVAAHLDKTIQAARLKGARTIVTGISDAVAETVVDLGIDWSSLETVGDLQRGLVMALNSLGIKLSKV